MNEQSLIKSRVLKSLTSEYPYDLLPEIQKILNLRAHKHKIVVLDDDSLGTQSVHGIQVLTEWSVPSLKVELTEDSSVFFILTNSRSFTLDKSLRIHNEIGVNLKEAAEQVGVKIEVVSRSDSTLRGHFPSETDVLAKALGLQSPPYLIIPFFLEGGRYTINNIHYVTEGDTLIPAAQTAYAQDASFGYKHSELREWVNEKTNGCIPTEIVASISLDILRQGNSTEVTRILASLHPGSACIVNAVSYRDIEVFVLGLLKAEEQGYTFLPRTAASFVRVRSGIAPSKPLENSELTVENSHGGLLVVGSYVPKTTLQVHALLEQTSIERIEVHVESLFNETTMSAEIQSSIESINTLISGGKDVLVYTSRGLIEGIDQQSSLAIGKRVSDSIIAILRGMRYQPRYLVAKGGITSSDMATKWLGVRRALVIGQILPGVPVWKLGEESRYPGMPYIIFPGNVGEVDALVQIQKRLSRYMQS